MTFLPKPRVHLDGAVLNCAPVPDDAGSMVLGAEVTVMAPLAITWGRSDVWSQPDPGELRFTLWDPAGTWAARCRNRQALHRPVEVRWTEAGQTLRIFKGHTVSATVERAPYRAPGAADLGWWVHLTVADSTAMLGNIAFTGAGFPAEAMSARMNRVRVAAEASGASIFLTYFDPNRTAAQVGPLKAEGQTALEVMGDCYRSTGRVHVYDPSRDNVKPTGRPTVGGELTGYLTPQAGGRVLYIEGGSIADTIPGGAAWPPAALDGSVVTAESAGLTFDLSTDINTLAYTYPYLEGTEWKSGTTVVSNTPNGDIPRTLQWTSVYSGATNTNSQVMYEMWDRLNGEAGRPLHPPILFDTRRTGGFTCARQAKALTLPSETPRLLWLSGSEFARWTEVWAPAFQSIGGRVEFDGEHWQIALNLGWYGGNAVSAPATWDSFVDPIKWDSPADYTLSDGLSWWDAGHLATGGIYGESE